MRRNNIVKKTEAFCDALDLKHEEYAGYVSLPEEERIVKYRKAVRYIEDRILKITGNPVTDMAFCWCRDEVEKYKVEMLLMERDYLISKMFELHCSDEEVERFEKQNDRLYSLTCDMFSRTGKMYRKMLDITPEKEDDELTVEGCLRYWGDSEGNILKLEDDEFYGSRFTELIIINAILQEDKMGDDEIMTCSPNSGPYEIKFKSSMTDEELGLDNYLDDGVSWAESWLRHPRLEHVCVCYATHALVTHSGYSIPDFLRLNTFEVKIKVMVQSFSNIKVL